MLEEELARPGRPRVGRRARARRAARCRAAGLPWSGPSRGRVGLDQPGIPDPLRHDLATWTTSPIDRRSRDRPAAAPGGSRGRWHERAGGQGRAPASRSRVAVRPERPFPRPSSSRRRSGRSGSRSGMSRRSTNSPARPPLTATWKRRPRVPSSGVPRNASSAGRVAPGGRSTSVRPPATISTSDRATPGLEDEAARRPVRPQAPRRHDGPEREEQVLAQIGDQRVPLRVVGDRPDRAEEAGMVDRHLQRARTADDVGDDVGSGGPRDRRPCATRPDHEVDARPSEHRLRGLRAGAPPPRGGPLPAGARHPRRGRSTARRPAPRAGHGAVPGRGRGEPVVDPVDRAGAIHPEQRRIGHLDHLEPSRRSRRRPPGPATPRRAPHPRRRSRGSPPAARGPGRATRRWRPGRGGYRRSRRARPPAPPAAARRPARRGTGRCREPDDDRGVGAHRAAEPSGTGPARKMRRPGRRVAIPAAATASSTARSRSSASGGSATPTSSAATPGRVASLVRASGSVRSALPATTFQPAPVAATSSRLARPLRRGDHRECRDGLARRDKPWPVDRLASGNSRGHARSHRRGSDRPTGADRRADREGSRDGCRRGAPWRPGAASADPPGPPARRRAWPSRGRA